MSIYEALSYHESVQSGFERAANVVVSKERHSEDERRGSCDVEQDVQKGDEGHCGRLSQRKLHGATVELEHCLHSRAKARVHSRAVACVEHDRSNRRKERGLREAVFWFPSARPFVSRGAKIAFLF